MYLKKDIDMNKDFEKLVSELPRLEVEKEILTIFGKLTEREIISLCKPLLCSTSGRVRISLFRTIVKKVNKHSNLIELIELGYAQPRMVSEIGYWIRIILPKLDALKFVQSCIKQPEDVKNMVRYQLDFIEDSEIRSKVLSIWDKSNKQGQSQIH